MDEFRFVSRFITIKLAGINPSQIMQIQKRKTGPVLWSRLKGGGAQRPRHEWYTAQQFIGTSWFIDQRKDVLEIQHCTL